MQRKRSMRKIAEELGINTSWMTQDELWREIVKRITGAGEGVEKPKAEPRRRKQEELWREIVERATRDEAEAKEKPVRHRGTSLSPA